MWATLGAARRTPMSRNSASRNGTRPGIVRPRATRRAAARAAPECFTSGYPNPRAFLRLYGRWFPRRDRTAIMSAPVIVPEQFTSYRTVVPSTV